MNQRARNSMGSQLLLIASLVVLAACSDSGGGSDPAKLGSLADVPDAIQRVEAPETGVSLGWGWDKANHEPIPTICVEFVEAEEPAQTRYMNMKEVSDSYEMMQSMGMSASASVKTIGIKAEGKASFAKSVEMSSSSSTFVLTAEVQNGVRYAAPMPRDGAGGIDESRLTQRGGLGGEIRLTRAALALADDKDKTEFKRMCGTSFVSAIYGGARLTAVLTREASNMTEKESMSASMSASGWGAEVKGEVTQAGRRTSSTEGYDLTIFQTGGSGDSIPANQDDLLDKLDTISLQAYTSPKDFSIAITPYELLSNWPSAGLHDPESEFDELASYWGAYNTLYDEIQNILDEPERFAPVGIDATGCVTVFNPVKAEPTKDSVLMQKLLTATQNLTNSIPETPEVKEENWREMADYLQRTASLRRSLRGALGEAQSGEAALAMNNNIAALKTAQDRILANLREIEGIARDCVSKSDTCEFDALDYRSPYAYRAQLLPPNGFAYTADDIIKLQVSDIVKRRCAESPNNAGCITNDEIDLLRSRIGMTPVYQENDADLYGKLVELASDEQYAARQACADGRPGTPAISVEPVMKRELSDDADPTDGVVWVNTAARLGE